MTVLLSSILLLLALIGGCSGGTRRAASAAPAESAVPRTPTSKQSPGQTSSYTWDGCQVRWPYYTTDHAGSPAAADSATIMSHLALRFALNGYRDYFEVAHEAYVNDVPANQPMTTMLSNHGHVYPRNWRWPIPANATAEGGFSGDAQLIIVQHTNPCTFWESASTQPASGPASYTSWTAGSYPAIQSAGHEVYVNPAGADPDGAGPTHLSNLIPDIKWEEVQSGAILHALELVLPPCATAGSSFVYPAARAEGIECGFDQSSMPFGATWIMYPNAPSHCDVGADPQSGSIIYALKHYGAVLQNTTGTTTNVVLYAVNALGMRYPNTSPYSTPALGNCHLLTDGYILPHGKIERN